MLPNQINKETRSRSSAPTKNQMFWINHYCPEIAHKIKTTRQASLIIEAFSGRTLVKGK